LNKISSTQGKEDSKEDSDDDIPQTVKLEEKNKILMDHLLQK